jgi:ATPase subunit of ABC transporter with duplicated ATPase domains
VVTGPTLPRTLSQLRGAAPGVDAQPAAPIGDNCAVSSIVVSELEYAPPGADSLFFDVSFGIAPGEHAALVGANGVGKSTILRILSGELQADGGDFALGGSVLTMTQDVGMSSPTDTLREMLIEVAPGSLKGAGRALVAAEKALASGDDDGMGYATALADWGDLGGYELELRWEAAARRSVKTPITDFSTRLVSELSGGERKRLVLDLLLTSGADVLLLDEPDNYLDIPTRGWLEEQILASRSTILMVSHDRTLLQRVATKIVVIEGSGAWVHGGSYTTFPDARARRQELLGDGVKRWNDEERRLFHHMKIMKQRAAQNFKNATKANAAETRWEKFVAAGPPPPPAPDQQIHVRLRGADSARRVARIDDVAIGDLFRPFSDEIHFGERLGLIGPNGTGKSHLLAALAGTLVPDGGSISYGPRTSIGVFNQINDRPDFRGRQCVEIVRDRVHDDEKSMKSLARYGLAANARQEFQTLSGGQKARLEILCLELEGHNVLLLDEPTDNLDVESSEALETALDGFQGTVVAVSHDRTFLSQFDRFLMITDDGEVDALPDYDVAMSGLADPTRLAGLRLAKSLT